MTLFYGRERKDLWFAFASVFVVALAFAIYTQHAWEDYYITYRVSKNLATGQGLVYTVGERVHAFTSPLNVLLPAGFSRLIGNRSDELVLWLFRLVSMTALAGAGVLLLDSARKSALGWFASLTMVGVVALDAKIVDFSINGQETGLMMFFLALTLHAFTVPSRWMIGKLGLAGAGLLWTRPDGFVYFGVVALGFLVFSGGRLVGCPRAKLLKNLFWAGLIMGIFYLPWVLWAYYYFGSPIPHTITAKEIVRQAYASQQGPILVSLLIYPFQMLVGGTSLDSSFLPAYALSFGGWHWTAVWFSRFLGCVCGFYWCLPSGRSQARAVSFAFLLSHFYLTRVVVAFAPWYIPNCTILAAFVLGHVVQHGLEFARARKSHSWMRCLNASFKGFAVTILGISALLLLCSAFQMRVQQREIEEGNRKQIGLWLREHAGSRNETVLLECLGYIGYFSQLKMLDVPGLCAPEVVAAERKLGSSRAVELVPELKPDWLVLRPFEVAQIEELAPRLLLDTYSLIQVFDVSERISAYRWLPGRGWLNFDEKFLLYQRKTPRT